MLHSSSQWTHCIIIVFFITIINYSNYESVKAKLNSNLSGLPEISQNPFPVELAAAARAAWAALICGCDQRNCWSRCSSDKISSRQFRLSPHSFMLDRLRPERTDREKRVKLIETGARTQQTNGDTDRRTESAIKS